MKWTDKLAVAAGMVLTVITIGGCGAEGSGTTRVNKDNSVDQVIAGQMEAGEETAGGGTEAETGSKGSGTEAGTESRNETETAGTADYDETADSSGAAESGESADSSKTTDDVDYDLTVMSCDIVYATVYQMMMDPDTYIGKTVRIDGIYHAIYFEATGLYYHYCIVQDAAACCSQGIEFVWEDGTHVYPDEYPAEGSNIVVEGIFETYLEEENLYCHLRDASIEEKETY